MENNSKVMTPRTITLAPRNILPILVCSYLVASVVRFIIALFIHNPPIISDELAYKSMALSFFRSLDFFDTHNLGFSARIPNVIYPLVISPAFFLKDNFYVGIKLINSLLMNASIFPLYLICRDLMDQRSALFVSCALLLLPAFTLTSLVMTENANAPVFFLCVFLAWKSLRLEGARYDILAGLSLALCLATKPTALALLLGIIISYAAMAITMIFLREKRSSRQYILSFFIMIAACLLGVALYCYVVTGRFSYDLGLYRRFTEVLPSSGPSISAFGGMILAYAVTFLFVYYIPVIIVFGSTWKESASNSPPDMGALSLLVMTIAISVFYLGMVFKLTLDMFVHESFSRLHGRIFFMISALFLIAASAFLSKIDWKLYQKIGLIMGYSLVSVLSISLFFPRYVAAHISFLDSPDLGWYLFVKPWVIWAIAVLGVLTLINHLFFHWKTFMSFWIFFVMFFLVANVGDVKGTIWVSGANSPRIHALVTHLRSTIGDASGKMVMVDSPRSFDRWWVSFWLPYNHVAVYNLEPRTRITRDKIPHGAQYLILFDDYDLDFPVSPRTRMGKMRVISLDSR